jgi:hypothetical protein
MKRSWTQLGLPEWNEVQKPMRQKEWYRGGVTRRLFNKRRRFFVLFEVDLEGWLLNPI